MLSSVLFGGNAKGSILKDSDISFGLETEFEHSNWWWTKAEVISTESTEYSNNPSCVVDSDGNVHVVWNDNTDYNGAGLDKDIFYKSWDYSSGLWSALEVVSTESTGSSYSPSLALDSDNNLHVAWFDSTDYEGADTDFDIFYKSRPSSGSWGGLEVVSTESTSSSQGHSLAIDSENNPHIVWQDDTDYNGAGGDSDIFYKVKPSSGSWGGVEVVSTESTSISDIPSLAVDSDNNVHVSWRDATDYGGAGTGFDIFYKVFDSSSNFWSVTNVVSTESTDGSMSSSLVVDSGMNVHIVWHDYTDYSGSGVGPNIFYKMWDDSSSTWSITEVVSTESLADGSYRPELIVDSADNLHVVWKNHGEYSGSGPDHDIYYKLWDATSGEWGVTKVVSTESTQESDSCDLTIDSYDNLHVVWYDWTDYLGSGSDKDVFYKKFVGPPTAPNYITAVPNFSTTGTISLDWADVNRADAYYLYRETAYITSTTGLTPLAMLNESNYMDKISGNGIYYYGVVSENDYGNSSLSVVEDVQVGFPGKASDLLPFISNEVLIVAGIFVVVQAFFFLLNSVFRRRK